ncbi:sugar transferase [Odoribacter sp. AF15-53]|uniref:sugar transferase n=1 Tax=Odoribacter sp. AF15-53 TaxID=2292236 RepID=UPI000E4B70CB|nr:sugar transferase [Odoribacter sp. AF15-53]RHR75803.1 sugar transferase [Odoribacter sp. AF15-53]
MYRRFLKRWLDFIIVFCVLLVIWPLFLVIMVGLHFANKGAGVFFFQERPGKYNKIFKVIKFKSMTDERDKDGKLLPDNQRLTKIGRFIRSTSMDELPQLFNVIKGDMSLIGPRPLATIYLPYYDEKEQHRHDVRPGITGWAQVNGRKSITWEQKLAYDIDYVSNMSLWMDAKIFFLTVYKVFKRENVGVGVDVIDFDDYRIAQWQAMGRQDLVDKARERGNR